MTCNAYTKPTSVLTCCVQLLQAREYFLLMESWRYTSSARINAVMPAFSTHSLECIVLCCLSSENDVLTSSTLAHSLQLLYIIQIFTAISMRCCFYGLLWPTGGCQCAGPFSQHILGISPLDNKRIELALLDKHEVLSWIDNFIRNQTTYVCCFLLCREEKQSLKSDSINKQIRSTQNIPSSSVRYPLLLVDKSFKLYAFIP